MKKIIVTLICIVFVAIYSLWSGSRPQPFVDDTVDVTSLLAGSDTAGFARADQPRQFEFPADHGPHPGYKTEWWYYTGNLSSRTGEHFGFQLTFFRVVLERTFDEGSSLWRSNQVYMAHLAVSDVSGKRFFAFERFSRAANGIAGARGRPFRVWLEDWHAEAESESGDVAVPDMELSALEKNVGVKLRLVNVKPPVLQGEAGLSQKGNDEGNASYYYSLTRMQAEGEVWVGDRQIPVSGTAWMDREWSTSALDAEQVGWDWFSLQLSDSTELMYYQLRRKDGTADPNSRGVVVDKKGHKVDILVSQVQVDILDTWESPRGGVYPSGWRLRVNDPDLDLTVTPLLRRQELDVTVRYWEGAVGVTGSHDGNTLTGYGYVELTGYAK